jgi:hypothetical protein
VAEGQMRHDNEFSELESSGDDLLDQAMDAEAFQDSRNLPAVSVWQMAAERFVLADR